MYCSASSHPLVVLRIIFNLSTRPFFIFVGRVFQPCRHWLLAQQTILNHLMQDTMHTVHNTSRTPSSIQTLDMHSVCLQIGTMEALVICEEF